MTDQQVWTLSVGCHKGTVMSRDNHVTTRKPGSDDPLLSLEDCIEAANHWKETYANSGYYLWFANAIAPDGTKHLNVIPGERYF